MCINCFQRYAATLVICRFNPKIQPYSYNFKPLRFISSTTTDYNHYSILGVGNNATDKEIKKAYLTKCQLYHPDKHPNNPTMHSKFVKVNEAYQVLGNTINRREYDDKMNFYRGIPNTSTRPNQYDPTRPRQQDFYDQHKIYKEFYESEFGNNRHNIPNKDPFTSAWNNFKFRRERKNSHADKKFILLMYSIVALVFYFGVIFTIYMRGTNDRLTAIRRNRSLQTLPDDHPAVLRFQNSLKSPRPLDLDEIDS